MSEEGKELALLSRRDFTELIRGRIRKALSKLGNTEADVVRVLTEADALGWRNSCRSCPLANWLARQLGMEQGDLVIWDSWVKVTSAVGHYAVTVDLPPHVAAFVQGFDNREYPELDAEEILRESNWDDAAFSRMWNAIPLRGVGAC